MHYARENILILQYTEIKIRSNNTHLCYFIFCCIFSIPYYIKYECPIKYVIIIRLNVINRASYLQSLRFCVSTLSKVSSYDVFFIKQLTAIKKEFFIFFCMCPRQNYIFRRSIYNLQKLFLQERKKNSRKLQSSKKRLFSILCKHLRIQLKGVFHCVLQIFLPSVFLNLHATTL